MHTYRIKNPYKELSNTKSVIVGHKVQPKIL